MNYPLDQRNGDEPGDPPGTDAEHALDSLRAELDAVDSTLLDTVRRRLEVCVHIAEVKRTVGIAMMQPHRVGVVHERARRYGARHGVSPEFLDSLYNLLIAEACRLEDVVIEGGDGQSATQAQKTQNAESS